MTNSPHLRPAWVLDRALWHLTCEVASGGHVEAGLPALLQHQQHLDVSQDGRTGPPWGRHAGESF